MPFVLSCLSQDIKNLHHLHNIEDEGTTQSENVWSLMTIMDMEFAVFKGSLICSWPGFIEQRDGKGNGWNQTF